MNPETEPTPELHPRIVELGLGQRMTKDIINELPLAKYESTTTVVTSPDEVDEAVEKLAAEPVLGFDTETRPAFKKGQRVLPSVLQVGGDGFVYVFMLKKTSMPPSLLRLLENRSVIKTGVAIQYDIRMLKEVEMFSAGGFLDLGDLARAWDIPNHGLRQLAAQLLGIRISKGAQRSNWDRYPLDGKQVEYATTDAWISREIYFQFKERDLMNPPPKPPKPPKKEKSRRREKDSQPASPTS